MKSIKEINDFIDSVDLGEPVYKMRLSYNDIELDLGPWQFKNNLKNDKSFWLNYDISRHLRRKFSIIDNKMILCDKDEILDSIKSRIDSAIRDVAMQVSPAEQPKRTKAYKDLVEIIRCNGKKDTFYDDMLPVLNYYYKSKTDTKDNKETMKVHKNNVFALFEILRKKYGNDNNSSG